MTSCKNFCIRIAILLLMGPYTLKGQLTFINATKTAIQVTLNWDSRDFNTDCPNDNFSLDAESEFTSIKNYSLFATKTCTLNEIIVKDSYGEKELKRFSHNNTDLLPLDVKSEDYVRIFLRYKNKKSNNLIIKMH